MTLRELFTPKRVFLSVGIILLLVFFSRQLVTTFVPFIIGIILAALLDPVIGYLVDRLRLPRGLAVGLTLLAVGSATFALLFFSISRMVSELIELTNLLPSYARAITELTDDLLEHFNQLNEHIPPVISLNIQRSVEGFLETLETGTRDLINRVLSTFASLPTFLLVSLISLVSTYFVARDKDLLVDTMLRLVPLKWRDQVSHARERVAVDLVGYLKGRILILIVAVLVSGIGFFIIGTRYWVLLALVVGILDTIPIIGPGVLFTPWIAVSALGGDLDMAVYLTILYFIIFAVHQLVEPKIMGDSVGIHPLMMLLALYGGIVFFGAWGIIAGPFVAILVKAIIAAGLITFPTRS